MNPDNLTTENKNLRLKNQELLKELENYIGIKKLCLKIIESIVKKLNFLAHKKGQIAKKHFQETNPDFQPYKLKIKTKNKKQKTKKILHAIPYMATGGSQQLVVDIIENLSDEYEHEILTREDYTPACYTGIKNTSTGYLNNTKKIEKILQKIKPDIVHIHYWGNESGNYWDWKWYHYVFQAALPKIPVLENCNDPIAPYHDSRIAHYIYVSRYAQMYYGFNALNEAVIYPGSNFELYKNTIKQPGFDCIGMVYRLNRDKLNENSIDVFISIVQKRPQTKALIVGGGFYFEKYIEKVNAAGLASAFTFTGYVPYEKLPEYYNQITVFIAPVHSESFGQVTPFAMNMAIPVIGYDVGALNEIINAPELLAKPNDTNELSNIAIQLLNNPEQIQKIGTANKQRANELFSLETMICNYDKIYQSLKTN